MAGALVMGKRAQFLGMEREDKGHHMLMIWSYLVGNGQVPGAHSPSPVHYLAIVPNPSPNLQGKEISGLPPSLVLIIIFYYLRVDAYSAPEVRRNQYYQATCSHHLSFFCSWYVLCSNTHLFPSNTYIHTLLLQCSTSPQEQNRIFPSSHLFLRSLSQCHK